MFRYVPFFEPVFAGEAPNETSSLLGRGRTTLRTPLRFPWDFGRLPSGKRLHTVTMENHHAINGKIHYKSPFSIANC